MIEVKRETVFQLIEKIKNKQPQYEPTDYFVSKYLNAGFDPDLITTFYTHRTEGKFVPLYVYSLDYINSKYTCIQSEKLLEMFAYAKVQKRY